MSKATIARPEDHNLQVTHPSLTQHLKILVYGPPGVGKTVLAGEANREPRLSPVLFIDCEAGTLSLAGQGIEVDVVRVTNFRQFNDVYSLLTDPNNPYKTVVLDSITEIQKLNLMGVVNDAVRMAPGRDPDRPQIDDWGKSSEQMRKLLRHFRDLPLHVIMTALSQEVKDETDGSITVKPALPGKLADEVSAMLDIVLYLASVETKENGKTTMIRRALTASTRKFVAKDRSGRLPQTIDNPTVSGILDLIVPVG